MPCVYNYGKRFVLRRSCQEDEKERYHHSDKSGIWGNLTVHFLALYLSLMICYAKISFFE
jgi:hypothetical protein